MSIGVKIFCGPSSICHMLFVDDSFFFFHAMAAECNQMKSIFHTYEVTSGQAINYDKSCIFFSRNTVDNDQELLSNIQVVHASLNSGRYLGLAYMVGRSKKLIFKHLRERL